MIFGSFSEAAPILTVTTLVICIVLIRKAIPSLLSSIDGVFAFLGLIFGIFMTIMNHFYTSEALFLLSPTIALGSSVYIHYRYKQLEIDQIPLYDEEKVSIFSRYLDISFWVLIFFLLFLLRTAEPYTRQIIFFIIVSLCVAIIGLDIILSTKIDGIKRSYIIFKTLLLSFIIRSSAYFISLYPVGSDPWVHSEYISFFIKNGHLIVPESFSQYYVNYPISNLLAAISGILANLEVKESLFVIGFGLIIGTLFVYLIVRLLTGNENLALFSLLLINFCDASIQWSVDIIAMSFGIVLYSFVLYLIFKFIPSNKEHRYIYSSIIFVLIFLIIWTHTIASFILLVTIVSLYVSIHMYRILYHKTDGQSYSSIILTASIFFCILLAIKWFDPNYPFIEGTLNQLLISLSKEASFLGKLSYSNITGSWLGLYNVLGFIMFAFFGIIGALYFTSKKRVSWPIFALIIVAGVLFFIRYVFPIMGIRNIIPSRWPAFAFVSFIVFVGVGIYLVLSNIKSGIGYPVAIVVILLFTSCLMITNGDTNMDSPLFNAVTKEKLIWSDSQMVLFKDMVSNYDGIIISDEQTAGRPLEIYYNRTDVTKYRLDQYGSFDYQYLNNKMVIWREESLISPIGVRDRNYVTGLLMGTGFFDYLERNFDRIGDSGTARAYL